MNATGDRMNRIRGASLALALLLTLVRVDAPALAGLQHDQVDAKGPDPERAAQQHEALGAVQLQRRERQII